MSLEQRVIEHSIKVSKLAMRFARKAEKNGYEVDRNVIFFGAMFHDVGRSKTHKLDHCVIGGDIIRSEQQIIDLLGSPEMVEAVSRIAERHIGGGIPPDEAQHLGSGGRVLEPETLEEKIVTHADNLILGCREVSFQRARRRFTDVFGEESEVVKRIDSLYKELESIVGPWSPIRSLS